MSTPHKQPVSRISVSLPEPLLQQLDQMVGQRGFESRSQAIAEMVTQEITNHQRELGSEIMAGTITLVYDHSTPGLQKMLADFQHEFINEVISSLHVHLLHAHTMEVMLVQGPAERLQTITDKLVTCRGVHTGNLHLTTAIIPPVHPLPGNTISRGQQSPEPGDLQ
jgi:CopG family nickel-responsive transcriptional regulator